MTYFKINEEVRATCDIVRKDRKSFLNTGEIATVTSVIETESSEIISISIKTRLPMIDIVCSKFGRSPLEKFNLKQKLS